MIPVMTRITEFRRLGLRALEPEPWGRRLARARANAGYSLRDVEARLTPHVSRAGLARLEDRPSVPVRPADRARAILVLLLYGVDPADFDLGPDDVPPATDLRALTKLRISRSGWMRVTAGRLVLAA
jgi:hypothetical protein